MKKTIFILLFCLVSTLGFSQSTQDIVGTWTFHSVTTTNPECKNVDYFPISTFKFMNNGKVEFNSSEGVAKASYTLKNKVIRLTDLSENGVKQEGSAEFGVKSVSKDTLILTIAYECGSIDIVFKK
jgi:hypothetical protein